jgi:hypothetical protein
MNRKVFNNRAFKCLTNNGKYDSLKVEIKTYIMKGENLYYGT